MGPRRQLGGRSWGGIGTGGDRQLAGEVDEVSNRYRSGRTDLNGWGLELRWLDLTRCRNAGQRDDGGV